MKAIKFFDETFTSRNFNLSPLSIDTSDYDSNKYDYEMVVFSEVESLNSRFDLNFNSDFTSNYRQYNMDGDGSSAGAFVNDTSSYMFPSGSTYSYPSLMMMSISGDTGQERYIGGIASASTASTDTKIYKLSNYWKNTLDKITEINISKASSVASNAHIIVYAIPKVSQGGWEKVDTASFSGTSLGTEYTLFSGLDGNSDKVYKIVMDYTESAGSNPRWRFNGDASTANYTSQLLRNTGGPISSSNNTTFSGMLWTGGSNPTDPNLTMVINAETGVKRTVSQSLSDAGGTFNDPQMEMAGWWDNTVDNLNSISFFGMNNGTGTGTLYRRMTPSSTDVLSWDLVESVDVSGDFSAGHTFSNLTGDSTTLYKVEVVGEVQDLISIRINGNSGADYIRQWLRGQLSTVTANSNQLSYFSFLPSSNIGQGSGSVYIYPKSGSQRPMLSVAGCDEEIADYRAGWYTDTTDEITSILVYSSASNPVDFRLKLWRLK